MWLSVNPLLPRWLTQMFGSWLFTQSSLNWKGINTMFIPNKYSVPSSVLQSFPESRNFWSWPLLINLTQDSLAPQFMPRLTPDSAGWPLLCGFSSKALLPISSLGHVHQTQVTSTSSVSFCKPYPWVILLGESHSLSAGREPAHDHTSFSIFEVASQGSQLIPKFISASSWWEALNQWRSFCLGNDMLLWKNKEIVIVR